MTEVKVNVQSVAQPIVHETEITIKFTGESGVLGSSFRWDNPLVQKHLHLMFGVREGEILTDVVITKHGIKGFFRTTPQGAKRV